MLTVLMIRKMMLTTMKKMSNDIAQALFVQLCPNVVANQASVNSSHTVEKSQTNATNVPLHPLRQAI